MIALRTYLQTSLVVTRCGTRHVKRIGRVSLGTAEDLHEALVSALCLFPCLFDPSKRGTYTSGELVDSSDMERNFSINMPYKIVSEKLQETKRQVYVEQGNQTASAADGGVSGTEGPLSHDVTGRKRAP